MAAYSHMVVQLKQLTMALDRDKKQQQENASNYKDKESPQWIPGDATDAQKKPGVRQKSNKAPFENPREE